MKIIKYLSLLFLTVLVFSCSDNKQSEEVKGRELPASVGAANTVLVLMDTIYWDFPVGQLLHDFLEQPYAVAINDEASFSYEALTFSNWKGNWRKKHSVIVPVLEDGSLNSELGEQLNLFGGAFIRVQQDLYARDQQITYLVAKDMDDFYAQLKEEKSNLYELLDKKARDKAVRKWFKSGEKKDVQKLVDEPFTIQLPKSMKKEMAKEDFVWFRSAEQGLSFNVYISWVDSLSRPWYEEEWVDWRETVGQKYLFGNEDSMSFMLTERAKSPLVKPVEWKGKWANRMYGLWRINKVAMGGSFVAYHFYDPEIKRNYYLEGFVYAPGQQKSNYIRSLEAILRTFHRVP